jgi:hypothetical protein
MHTAEFAELSEPAEPAEPAEAPEAPEPAEPADVPPTVESPNDELAVIRNELTSALHEANYQRRKRADAVQLLAYERLARRSRVSASLWLVAALLLGGAGAWAFFQSVERYDLWQIGALSAGALALVALVTAVVAGAGPSRARQSLSLRQVRRLTPPDLLSEAWFAAAHEVGTPREYRRAFHGLV